MSYDPNRDYKNEFYYRESLRRKVIVIIFLVVVGLTILPFLFIFSFHYKKYIQLL